ncbi:MAG: T9SS type A sorting domain-containing protein [Candidatus Marinimicrobia bacterium]|nr:T9SS type A sorting domain-containing protein [Candidatus Neomarinimicrobiota bacterium]
MNWAVIIIIGWEIGRQIIVEHCDDTDDCTANIPSEIGNLTELTFLSLSDNHLSGEIPSSIGNLVNLERLSFWDNDLSGEIPESIGNLTNLNLLWLKHNQLTGPIPSTIGNLTQLGEDVGGGVDDYQPGLDLSYNELTGEIPSSIGNLTNLATLVLEYNQLTGPLPPEIGYMTSLVTLNLKNNQINGVIPSELEYLSNMSCLWLAYNNLRGEIPEELCNIDVCGSQCNNSNYVFSGNNLCPPYPQCFEEFGIPSYPINIIDNQLCNPYPNCPNGYTPIADPPPINGGEIYDGWCFYQDDLDNLQDFIDVNESLNGEPLEIGEQSWTGGPSGYGYGWAYEDEGYGRLSLLDFSNENNEISIIPESIGNLDELEVVNFSNTQITTIPASLGNLSELKSLSAEGGQLTGSIPPELGNLTNLMYLRLYDNQLTGSIPVELGNTNLHTLDLRNNQLSGEVPLEIWNMEAFYESGAPYGNLRRIYLRHNQFTGVLPEDLCEIDLRWNSYNFIDIRNNQFCPPYPSCLENKMGSQDTSYCSGVNVYPGDTDNNGIVDALDVLPIGVYFFENGAPRDTTGFFWSPVSGEPWEILPATFSDANGDGVVDEIDIIGVGVNWGKTHETRGNTFVLDPNDETLFINHQAAFQEIYNSLSGGSEVIDEIREMLRSVLGIQIPEVFSLYQNYPNPFNPTTTIQFHLPTDESVSLTVYNILGKTVIEPIKDMTYQSGTYSILLDGSQLGSGLYYYALKAGMYHDVRKMIVMK